MREEKFARAAAASLTVVPLLYLALYLLFGQALAQAAFWYFLGCTLVGLLAGWALGARHPLLQIAAAAIPSAALALLLPLSFGALRYVAMGLGALMAVWVERRYVVDNDSALKSGLLIAPLGSLLAVSAVLWFQGRTEGNVLGGVWATVITLGVSWFVLSMFLMNRLSLRMAARAARNADVPAGVRRSGTLGIMLFLVITLLLASIGALAHAIGTFFQRLAYWIIEAFVFLANLFSQKAAPGGSAAPAATQQSLPLDQAKTSPLMQLITNILIAAVLLAVVFGILYGLYRLLPKLWKKLMDRLKGIYGSWREEDAGYQDRLESLMSFRQAVADAGSRLRKLTRRFRRKPRLEDFPTNGGKVRFLFRTYLQALADQKKLPPPGATATDIAWPVPTLGPAYNLARYGEEEPDREAVESARKALQSQN